MRSIWSNTVTLPTFEPLNQDIKTDVLIIGGGITGILCAYMLEQAHVDYVLVEAKEICSGVTENTTAKITSQHGMIYHKMLKRFGTEKTRLYLNAN
jgi:glycine/D-amino acid oxidase-like deaminating enzyme